MRALLLLLLLFSSSYCEYFDWDYEINSEDKGSRRCRFVATNTYLSGLDWLNSDAFRYGSQCWWESRRSSYQSKVIILINSSLMSSCRDQSPHPAAENMESNNNIAGVLHQDRLYLAWRTAPLHFAGRDTRSDGQMVRWSDGRTFFK